jgi:hypothetical protein
LNRRIEVTEHRDEPPEPLLVETELPHDVFGVQRQDLAIQVVEDGREQQ